MSKQKVKKTPDSQVSPQLPHSTLKPEQLVLDTWPCFAWPYKSGLESPFGRNKCGAEPVSPPVTSPCVKFTALFSLGGPCKAGGLKSGSLISRQIRAPGTREALSLGLIHTFCEEKGIAPVSGGCAAAGPAGAAKAVPWEGECPRAAEESQGIPRNGMLPRKSCSGRQGTRRRTDGFH